MAGLRLCDYGRHLDDLHGERGATPVVARDAASQPPQQHHRSDNDDDDTNDRGTDRERDQRRCRLICIGQFTAGLLALRRLHRAW